MDWNPDPVWEKNPEPGSEMNIPDLIFENLVLVFWAKRSGILSTMDPG
jgi:hypothetical protein